MLDAFKNMTGGRNKQLQTQTTDLETLIATAREERSALSAMITSLTTRGAKLTPLSQSMEQVHEKANGVTARLDDISKRLATVDTQTKLLDAFDKRIKTLDEVLKRIEDTTLKAVGPDGDLRKHRDAVQQLSSQALQTQASLDTLRKEYAALEQMRGQLRDAQAEAKVSLASTTTLKGEFDQVRGVAATLTQDYAKIRETAREAREDTGAAMATVKDL